jgi:hypothetical protein
MIKNLAIYLAFCVGAHPSICTVKDGSPHIPTMTACMAVVKTKPKNEMWLCQGHYIPAVIGNGSMIGFQPPPGFIVMP